METKTTPLLFGANQKTKYNTETVTETVMNERTPPPISRIFKPLAKMPDECHGALIGMLFFGATVSYLAISNCSCEHAANNTQTNQTLEKVDPNGRATAGIIGGIFLVIPCLYGLILITQRCKREKNNSHLSPHSITNKYSL